MKKIIIFTILILSLAITGCIKKTSPPTKENVDKPVVTPVIPLDKQDEQILEKDEQPEQPVISPKVIEGIEDWRVYEKKEKNIYLKYHKDWYYDRDEQAEKDLNYNLYVGFAETPEVLEQGREYPIEFLILDKDTEWIYNGYLKKIAEKDDKQYILRTGNQEKYGEIIDKMAESFEFIIQLKEE